MTLYDRYGLFIGGDWQPAVAGAELDVIDPATEDRIGRIPRAGTEDLDRALAALACSAPEWRATPGWTRSAILRETARLMAARAEQAARDMSEETGKPLAEAKGEWQAAVDQFDWYADEARRIWGHTLAGREADVTLDVRYEPVGPVAAFTAWNFPALLPARKVAAALAAGCPIVIKPSEEAPSSMFHIAGCAAEAGLPAGVLNVVTGDPAEISAHLIASPVIRKVSLTGSVPVGRLLAEQSARGLKKVSMELGGHAPVLVFPDADPDAVGEICAKTKFRNAGQVCISPSRFYVHEDIYAPFSEAMARVARAARIGRGLDDGVDFGPMANARGRDRVLELIGDAQDRGAELLAGGGVPKAHNRGFYIEPTVLGRVPEDARIMTEEPFGPVAPISTFRDFDEVMARANDVPFGLASYVFSGSLPTANRAAAALETGMVGVNDMLLAAAEVPFGGIKDSGMGREGGQLGILEYLEPKYVKYRYS
ncbi:NAD-dependent succinate-semialdehyde dehydrogenase [Salipiger bermudensis]|uniref:NAD-dependent succinate-semialdehyde dehydrogenase n=1 Tax=Salipiger bermudensis TaxID=344736 RepID=UPI001A8F7448|nr:NAD-dependent succinate-semialdehyde dehydrogenase [Salipiger bermudensis]MBN9678495.1 NAD-dependent succinate-semialdehyde dehydrogenase [Salipiger bermudensis]